MTEGVHERAVRLMDRAAVEGVTPAEQGWLESHLAECGECEARAAATRAALRSVAASPVELDPRVVAVTRSRVHARAAQMRQAQAAHRPLWIACFVSAAWVLLTMPYLWQAFDWLGGQLGVSRLAWQVAFLLAWFIPASVVGLVLAWKRAAPNGARPAPPESEVYPI